ncbi:hypothetical protein CGLO_06609 [Colletotrichum gloeosporioides Cg-14]|uniref:DUF3500 domain-containing protein n=1 Tax=Colletotrichum gloeosporioides (strain Cg-14) TaxID=1237896 RepID=T0LYS1_COLGC|nr:hypothetical protein CGLO_06609 [Colletotrichum gloeosporioides Cg-14]
MAPTQRMVARSLRMRIKSVAERLQVQAARTLLQVLSPSEKRIVSHSLDSEDWRKWMNPEFVLFKCGLRLEDLEEAKIESIMNLVQSSLDDKGFDKVRGAMKTNKFLGELCSKKAILNEYSYFFAIFGEPSETEPWSYMLFGHHLALNVFIARQQMVIGPVFIGAEPSIIDDGPDKGITLCAEESELGLRLMQSLSPAMQKKAQLYSGLHDSAMPEGRWNPADQRHLAGAFQDNRVIPYEGVLATDMTIEQRELLVSIISTSTLLPPGPLEFRLADVREHLAETYFCWIGGFSSTDPFYYRIQSPVTLFEFDHHSGVFLTNDEPAKYHIHTIQRLPNGNDYGRSLRELLAEEMGEDDPEYKVWPGNPLACDRE